MNKFKGFFTLIAFIWLFCCGILAISQWISKNDLAWLGLAINAFSLPIWMNLRYWRPQKFAGDLREAPAFLGVLAGLSIVLLTDSGKGQPTYLAIINLFWVLIYLYHLSAFRIPAMPAVGTRFPKLKMLDGKLCELEPVDSVDLPVRGQVLVFLRGTYCADSRALFAQLADRAEEFAEQGVNLSVFSTEPSTNWTKLTFVSQTKSNLLNFVQLDPAAEQNQSFVAAGAVPYWNRFRSAGLNSACRPSLWLLDRLNTVQWRYLSDNYRLVGSGGLIRSQLFRLQSED